MLVSEAIALAYMLVGDSPSAPAYVQASVIEDYIYEAVSRASRKCSLMTAEVSLELESSTQTAVLPDGFIQLEAASWDGVHLEPTTRAGLRLMDEEWEHRIGAPSHFYLDEIQNKIGVWRRPDSQGLATGLPDAPTSLDADVQTVIDAATPLAPTDLTGEPEV
jgi:hypothetical protein